MSHLGVLEQHIEKHCGLGRQQIPVFLPHLEVQHEVVGLLVGELFQADRRRAEERVGPPGALVDDVEDELGVHRRDGREGADRGAFQNVGDLGLNLRRGHERRVR